MVNMSWSRVTVLLMIVSGSIALQGCGTLINPASLAAPTEVSCIMVPEGTEAHEALDLFKHRWTIRVEAGPYFAEHVDAKGTYFRGPPGAISIMKDGMEDKPAGILTHMNYDGGIFVPTDAALAPHLYNYFSVQSTPVSKPPANATCANTTYSRETNANGVSMLSFALGGAVGGASGGAMGRSANPNSSMSYGQAVGAGAVGGAVAGLMIAGLINSEVGKIGHRPDSRDPAFVAALREIAKSRELLNETRPGTASQNSVP